MPLKPLKIDRFLTGLVQNRSEFALKDDAFPILENSYVFREKVYRKRGTDLIGRLRRCLTSQSLTAAPGSGTTYTENIKTKLSLESNASIEQSSLVITIGTLITVEDDGVGGFTKTGGSETLDTSASSINYQTMVATIVISSGAYSSDSVTADLCYYPSLPVMGIWQRDLSEVNDEQTVIFDTTYAYRYNNVSKKFQELSSTTPTTWTGDDADFFWCTNYWNVSTGANQLLLFWATNGTGRTGDPIRYYHPGTPTWTKFGDGGSTGAIDGTNFLNQSKILEPFRSRLVAFNTWEGTNLANSTNYPNRIRWCQIGNPIDTDSWRSDIRGKGGFIDLPTNQTITGIGFVRDNLIVYCERSTWKLRYTGQAISPFAPEKVNTELGVESTFSPVNFDTSNMGIGDKGIISTDSYKAERVDYKIPDLVYTINNDEQGVKRVQGMRDFQQRTAFWTYCDEFNANKFPNKRLMYNYENDSWALFEDSFTALGVFQVKQSLRWQDVDEQWQNVDWQWQDSQPDLKPENVGGNQKGFVSYLDAQFNNNDVSLPIEAITLGAGVKTDLTIVNHNLSDGQFINISGILGTADYTRLNGNTYKVDVRDNDTIRLIEYSSADEAYISPFDITATSPSTYYGGGLAAVRDNFKIQTKKFNFVDQGKNTVFGFLDILCDTTFSGEFAMNAYVDYSAVVANTSETVAANPMQTDPFFNAVISTAATTNEPLDTGKTFQRVNCNFRGRFVSLEFTLNDKQMNGNDSVNQVTINSMVLWMRPGGHLGF